MQAVSGLRILIAEDEFLLATDLARYFQGLGADILGPVADVDAARSHAGEADAAVLDIDLNGEPVFPVADDLASRGVPFVFFSGRGDIALPERFRYASHLLKPLEGEDVAKALFGDELPDAGHGPENVFLLLPRLRLSARLMLRDAAAADRLVELALEEALASLRFKPPDIPLDLWLGGLLEVMLRRSGARVMN